MIEKAIKAIRLDNFKPMATTLFINENFTESEYSYCLSKKQGFWASLAVRWAAKQTLLELFSHHGISAHPKELVVNNNKSIPVWTMPLSLYSSYPFLNTVKLSLSHEFDLVIAISMLNKN